MALKDYVCPSCGEPLEEINGQQFCNNPACEKHRQEAEAKIKEDEAKGPAEEGGKKRGKR